MQFVCGAGPAPVGEALQFELDVGEHLRVEQLAELLGPEQVTQEVAVERQRSGAAFGERGVALVHVGGDPVEQQARRHRARLAGVDADHPDRPRAQLAEHLTQRRHVEHVLQALARGLEEDRERRVLRRHRKQIGRPLTLLPQRRAAIRASTRQQQGPAGALAESGGEQRRLGQRRHDQFVDVLGVDQQRIDRELHRPTRAGGSRCRRRPTSSRPGCRTGPSGAVRSPSPTARAPASRTDSRCTPASRRSRPGIARPPPFGRRGPRRSPRSARRGTGAGCPLRTRRARSGPSAVRLRPARRGRALHARTPPALGPTPTACPGGRHARTASCPAGPAPADTVTRSKVMSSIRHVDAPSTNVSPGRLS